MTQLFNLRVMSNVDSHWTEIMIVVTNFGLILVTLALIGSTILAQDKIVEVVRMFLARRGVRTQVKPRKGLRYKGIHEEGRAPGSTGQER